jgi:hypothetical protein
VDEVCGERRFQRALRRFIIEHPDGVEDVIQLLEEASTEPRSSVRHQLAAWGLDPANYDTAAVLNRTARPIGGLRAFLRECGLVPVLQRPPGASQSSQQPRGNAGGAVTIQEAFKHFLEEHREGLEDVIACLERENPGIRGNVNRLLVSWGLNPSNYDTAAVLNRTARPIGLLVGYVRQFGFALT